MIVYGGTSTSNVWALSLRATLAWTQLSAAPDPVARSHHCAAYDPVGQRMVIYGGEGASGQVLDDAWALSLSGTPAWTRFWIPGPSPGGLQGQSAIYDPAGERMLFFSGRGSGWDPSNACWALALGATPAWTEFWPSGTPPAARWYHSTIYDPVGGRMIVCGGTSTSSTKPGDTYALDLASSSWSFLWPTENLPAARSSHTAIYDPVRDRMIVYGGVTNSGASVYTDDVWTLSLSVDPEWTRILEQTSTGPIYGGGSSAIYDPVRDQMIVFGGYCAGAPNYGYSNDVWTLNLSGAPSWHRRSPLGPLPGVRCSHSAIYDPVRDRLLVFGGYYVFSGYLHDVWALSLSGTMAWTQLHPSGYLPQGRAGHVAAYDPLRDRMLIFGGAYGTSTSFDDTWALSLADTSTWTLLTPTGPAPQRSSEPGFYDPIRDRLVVFGYSWGSSMLNDVRALSLADPPSWSTLSPAGAPARSRNGSSVIYDPTRDCAVIFGGNGPSSSSNDTYELHFDSPDVSCPEGVTWGEGPTVPVYQITNPYARDVSADYLLTSQRNWPGFPLRGTVQLPSAATTPLELTVPVPDTAAGGFNALRLDVAFEDPPRHVWCEQSLHDSLAVANVSLVSVAAEPGLVRLVWCSAARAGRGANVYRRSEGSDWAKLATVVLDGQGFAVYEDRAVELEARYAYRLGLPRTLGEDFSSEVWVTVPRAPILALGGAWPNPAAKRLAVSFSLPDASPARIELLDASGRRVSVRDVGGLGPGEHVLPLGEERPLPSGIYLVRLTQGSRSLVKRAVLLR
jgi:hypothetical protein